MRAAIGTMMETVGGLWSLFLLGCRTRFRFGGAYWRWRHETAFGHGEPSPDEKRRAVIHYARWMWRMGRGM
jgi:hypothetical protein